MPRSGVASPRLNAERAPQARVEAPQAGVEAPVVPYGSETFVVLTGEA